MMRLSCLNECYQLVVGLEVGLIYVKYRRGDCEVWMSLSTFLMLP